MLKTLNGTAGNKTLQALVELVEALERRVPRPHASGEKQIAADAAHLHAQASKSIEDIESLGRERAEIRQALSIMADDGAPIPRCPEGEQDV
jgi:hypothetical protein